MAKVCVLLADGFEEIEALTVVDVLRRADVETALVGVRGTHVRGSHDIVVRSEISLDEAREQAWDLVYLPGGMPGASNLRDDPDVQALVRAQIEAGRHVAAICAAPIALERAGVLAGRRATSFPGFAKDLVSLREYVEDRVVTDGPVITSRGPGTAMELAFALVTMFCGEARAASLRASMLVR